MIFLLVYDGGKIQMGIPKIIHYCWFGGREMPELEKRCLQSWDSYLPDYEKVLWNEDTFDISSNNYAKQAYKSKKYAFVSDVARLNALYHYGGIYIDTDVEIIKNLDRFLIHPAFAGLEDKNWISSSLIGANKKHRWIKSLFEFYHNKSFYLDDGQMDLTTNVRMITDITKKEFSWNPGHPLRRFWKGIYIYPADYFCPKDWTSKQLIITKNTHAIHHFSSSWWK
jgi:hypothetical protein